MADRRRKAKMEKELDLKKENNNCEFGSFKFESKKLDLTPNNHKMNCSNNDIRPEEKEFIDMVRANYPNYHENEILYRIREMHNLGYLKHVYNKEEVKKIPKNKLNLEKEYDEEEKQMSELQKRYGIEDPDTKRDILKDPERDLKVLLEVII